MLFLKTYKNINSKIRNKLIDKVKTTHDPNESGISSLISALGDFRDHVIVLFNNKKILGAVSYYLSKKNYIVIDHIGVVEQHQGYGSILMKAVFKIADKLNRYPVSLTTNGYSNDFYEKMGMKRVNNKMPAVYELKKEDVICTCTF